MEEVIEKEFQRKLNIDNCFLCLRYNIYSKKSEIKKKLKQKIIGKMGLSSLQCEIFNSPCYTKTLKYFIKRIFMEPLSDKKRRELIDILCENNFYALRYALGCRNLFKYKEFKDLFVFNGKKFKIKNHNVDTMTGIIAKLFNFDYLGIEIDNNCFRAEKEVIVNEILYGYGGCNYCTFFKNNIKKVVDFFKRNTYYNDLIIEELKKNMKSFLHLMTTDDKDEKKHSNVIKTDILLILYEGLIGIDDDWIKLDKTRY